MSEPRSEKEPPVWAIKDGGLTWHSDWFSVQWLADALNGPEDEGRIPESDVESLLGIIERGLAAEIGRSRGSDV